MGTINTQGLSKAAILAALYNAAAPQGMGFLHFDATPMTEQEAQAQIDAVRTTGDRGIYFDYLKGRSMKLDLSDDDEFDPRWYDRDAGSGAAQRVIDSLRAEGSVVTPTISAIHREETNRAADVVLADMQDPGGTSVSGGVEYVRLTTFDKRAELGPMVRRAKESVASSPKDE